MSHENFKGRYIYFLNSHKIIHYFTHFQLILSLIIKIHIYIYLNLSTCEYCYKTLSNNKHKHFLFVLYFFELIYLLILTL